MNKTFKITSKTIPNYILGYILVEKDKNYLIPDLKSNKFLFKDDFNLFLDSFDYELLN